MQGNNTPGASQGNQPSHKPTLSWSQPGSSANQPTTSSPKSASPSTMQQNQKQTALTTRNQSSSMGLYTGIFVGGLIVGVLLGWGITSLRHNPSSDTAINNSGAVDTTSNSSAVDTTQTNTTSNTAAQVTNSNAPAGTVAQGGAAVDVATPQPAGSVVKVSHISATVPTWVAVYDGSSSATLGRALGATLFFPPSMGGATSGTIELLRPMVAGNTYMIVERLDDGNKKFSSTADKTATASDGSIVWATVKAQ